MSSNEIDITDVSAEVTATVVVKLRPGTAPDMRAQYVDRMMQPDRVQVEYRFDAGLNWWFAISVKVTGHRLLKPAANGTPRIGKDTHSVSYGGWRADVQADNGLPGWLDRLVIELRPSGQVSLPGVG